jgi:type III restriction enzyme
MRGRTGRTIQLTVHIQDEIGHVGKQGNLFLSNIHRVFEGSAREPSIDDEDTTDYFLGPKPVTKTTESLVDLSQIVREVDDLVVLNDEANHIHEKNAWFRAIEDTALKLRQKGKALSAQFDLSATPKHNNGVIFVETVSDYPLVEAIRQGVVKTPVVPDEASRARLVERQSSEFVEKYRDCLHLGYLEWKKSFDELSRDGKKPVMFVMTDDTKNCDAVSEHLQRTYREFAGAALVIHTKNNGEISEAATVSFPMSYLLHATARGWPSRSSTGRRTAGSPIIFPTSSSRPGIARSGLSRPRGASISRTRRNGGGSSNGARMRPRQGT